MACVNGTRISSIRIECARAHPRRRLFAAGVLTGERGPAPHPCLIRDLSPGGAQVRISALAAIPGEAFLVNRAGHLAYSTRPLWRQGSLMGLRLHKTYVINKFLPEDLHFLVALLNQMPPSPPAWPARPL